MSFHTRLFRLSILAIKRLIASLLLLGAAAPLIRPAVAQPDILYVGDSTQIVDFTLTPPKVVDSINLVRRFDANTGAAIPGGNPAGVYVVQDSNDLDGPRGIIRVGSQLLVGSQNITKSHVPGQILRYKLSDGRPDGVFVPSGDNSPFTPDGIICWKGVVYASDISTDDEPDDNLPPGRLLAYDASSGKLLRKFEPPQNFGYKFHPRGLVIGPNGLLYVSSLPDVRPGPAIRLGGQIFVFDPATLDFLGVFVSDLNESGLPGHLNRPDALVFGPDGNLYVMSFRASPSDTDSIRIYNGHTGVYLDKKIELYTLGNPRAFAQGILFGPGGKLFVAISGNDDAGQIRAYNVETETFDVFATATGSPPLWYLTFGKTNPGTLAYEGN